MTPTDEEIERIANAMKQGSEWSKSVGDMLLALKDRAEAAEEALQAIVTLPSVDGLNEAERTRQELRLIEQARHVARAALEAKS